MKQLSILVITLATSFCIFFSQPALAACGCTNMTVTWGGLANICSNNNVPDVINANECTRTLGGPGTACPNNTYVYNCSTGVNSQNWMAPAPYQKTGFRITTTYAPNSTYTDCTPGQILQLTITSNGGQAQNPPINPTSLTGNQTFGNPAFNVRINNNASQSFPRVDQQYGTTGRQYYGGDNYIGTATDVVSSQSNTGSQWWDNTDQSKDAQNENATWAYRFISFVRGSDGQQSCSCAKDITVNWPANMNPVTQIMTAANGNQNCP